MRDIFLTGPKHSGKTSAGKTLAQIYLFEFIDLDEIIFQQTGKTPRQLFLESQAVFQKAETDALNLILDSGGTDLGNVDSCGADSGCIVSNGAESGDIRRVIAAGGGIIDNIEAVDTLKKIDAIIVYLDISAAAAWNRIINSNGGELPPFLKTDDPKKSGEEIHRELHDRRAAGYSRISNIIIKTDGKTPEEIAAEIQENLLSSI